MQTQFEDHGALLCSIMPCCSFSSIIFSISSFCAGEDLSGLALKLGISVVLILHEVECLSILSGAKRPSLLITLVHFKAQSINLFTSQTVRHFLGTLKSIPISLTMASLFAQSSSTLSSGIGHSVNPQQPHTGLVGTFCDEDATLSIGSTIRTYP